MAEGATVVAEARDARARVEARYVVAGTDDPVIDAALALGVRVYDLAPGVMEKIADTVTPQPVLAVVGSSTLTLEDLRAPLLNGGFVVVGADVRDPGNAGTLIRSAEGSGACGVVLCAGSVETTNPKTVRASAGAIFHVPVIAGEAPASVLGWLGRLGVRRWGTAANDAGATDYDKAQLTGPTALVLGNEAHGLPEGVDVDGFLSIPMAGRTESLNVAMATAVVCFEAARQRRG